MIEFIRSCCRESSSLPGTVTQALYNSNLDEIKSINNKKKEELLISKNLGWEARMRQAKLGIEKNQSKEED